MDRNIKVPWISPSSRGGIYLVWQYPRSPYKNMGLSILIPVDPQPSQFILYHINDNNEMKLESGDLNDEEKINSVMERFLK